MNIHAIDTGATFDNQEEYGFNLLIEEPPLQVLPSLAEAIGLEESIVIQQLHYFERKGCGRVIKGAKWIFNTYEEWRSIFPFWSERTLRRIFCRLEEMRLVESCMPEGGISRRKYYRINRGGLNLLRKGKLKKPDSTSGQIGRMIRPDWPLPNTETTYIESKESKETPLRSEAGASDFSEAQWKPNNGTKKEKLKRLKTPRNYPSEREFDDFLNSAELDAILTYRPELYSELCDRKWHEWRSGSEKWVRILDWRKYIMALNGTITRA